MNPGLRTQLDRLAMRLAELDALLAEPTVAADHARWRQLSRERAEAAQSVRLYRTLTAREADLATAVALLRDAGSDADMRAMAEEERAAAAADIERLGHELQTALLPRDPDDDRDVFLEIRAGTGGDESALFAGDLARMYLRHAERHRWQSERVSENASELGGYREVIYRLSGEGVYGRLKFESGGHRVQRVPVTEAQGRIHTSACTVAVMPEADPAEELALEPKDLRIDTFRSSGAGGQHVNKTDSAIRITHLPTGLVAECQNDRSQHRNKAKAMAVLTARLRERERNARAEKEAATRKSLVGSGDRSDRIRTYNFPQGRVTDHRIGLTLHRLQAVLDGDLDELTAALQAAQAREQLQALEQGTGGG